MTFQILDNLPKREPRGFDAEQANALLAAIQAAPADGGASDGTAYASEAEARAAAAKMKRLAQHVADDGTTIGSRVFVHPTDANAYAWALKFVEPRKKGKGK
jgi:hypothetical protein